MTLNSLDYVQGTAEDLYQQRLQPLEAFPSPCICIDTIDKVETKIISMFDSESTLHSRHISAVDLRLFNFLTNSIVLSRLPIQFRLSRRYLHKIQI